MEAATGGSENAPQLAHKESMQYTELSGISKTRPSLISAQTRLLQSVRPSEKKTTLRTSSPT